MIRTVVQGDLDVHHREAGHNAGLQGTLDTGVDSGDEFLGDGTAHHRVDELIALAGLVGLHGDLDMAILAGTAALALVLGLLVHLLADSLLVSHLGSAHIGLHLELTEQTINNDLQMELAHASDDGLAGLLIGIGLEGGVLFRQLHQCQAHLLLTSLGLGLDGDTDHGLGEVHGLQDHGGLFVAQGITGGGVLQAHGGGNIAGLDLFDVLTVVGVHLQDTAHALLLVLHAVENGGTGGQVTGVHTEEAQTAHIGVGHDLEGQSGEGLIIVWDDGPLPHRSWGWCP